MSLHSDTLSWLRANQFLLFLLKEKLDDAKGVIRSRKSKDRQHKAKRTNNDRQNITQKTKDRATRKLGWSHVLRKDKHVLTPFYIMTDMRNNISVRIEKWMCTPLVYDIGCCLHNKKFFVRVTYKYKPY